MKGKWQGLWFTTLLMMLWQPGFGQEYLWPTDASHWITSSFAEFRPRRFHAAIDIKTWNRTGYKIFAVRDGWVHRIRVSPFGYGKAIYLKLDTGEIAVYAHLSGFNPKLENIVRREQEKNGRYRVNRYFAAGALPVKKGDFLGYTGETGIGVPHLHFELRDPSNRPINPFTRGFRIDDVVAPTPTKVALIPLNPGSVVQNDFAPYIVRPRRLQTGLYVINDTLTIDGEVGVAVAGFDRSGTVRNRFGLYELELRVDGQMHFRTRYDRFNYAHNRFVELDRDYRLQRRGKGLFYRLFLDPANRLEFYDYAGAEKGRLVVEEPLPMGPVLSAVAADNGSAGSGWHRLSPGIHEVEILLRDFFLNSTSIRFVVLAGRKYRIFPQFAVQDSAVVLQEIGSGPGVELKQVQIWQRNTSNHRSRWRLLQALRLPQAENEAADSSGARRTVQARLFGLPGGWRPSLLKLAGVDTYGVLSWPEYFVLKDRTRVRTFTLRIQPDFYDDYVRFAVAGSHALRKAPLLEITLEDGSTRYPAMYAKSPFEYVTSVPLAELASGRVTVRAHAENAHLESASDVVAFEVHRIARGSRGMLWSPDSLCRISFWKSSLYRDLYGRIERISSKRFGRDAHRVSEVYEAHPQDVPLNDGALVSLTYPQDVSDPGKLGVYYLNRKNKWVFIDNQLDTDHRRVSAKVFSLEVFCLRKDETPPIVELRQPRGKRAIAPTAPIRVFAKDEQSGFESEESLELYVDGRKVIAEYDPENDVITYIPRAPLSSGPHRLRFRATDRSGNVTEINRTFLVQ